MASCDGTGGGAVREDAINARLTHPVVTFRVDEEAEVLVKVEGGFADGADLFKGGDRGRHVSRGGLETETGEVVVKLLTV